VDRHKQTALSAFGEAILYQSNFDAYRHAGKQLNFLILFLGGAEGYQKTVLNNVGLDIPLSVCRKAIQDSYRRYGEFARWQKALIETAKRKGYIYIPLIGQSRSFLGSQKAIQKTYISEIVSIKIQGVAACILESAHVGLSEAFRLAKLQACITLSIHDSLDIELPERELNTVRRLATACFTMPLYLRKLQEELGRTEPDFPVEEKIIATRP
jgi:DNA polymerase I-like protein with 3'-5' exonuclease and polymerase domains